MLLRGSLADTAPALRGGAAFFAVLASCFGCISSPAVEGYWVRTKDVGTATDVWFHFRDDGTCEVSIPGEIYAASYSVRGDAIVVRAQHELRCTVVKRDTLHCTGEAGSMETFARAPGRPAHAK